MTGTGADPLRPFAETVTVPFQILLMGLWHMLCNRTVLPFTSIKTAMGRNPVAYDIRDNLTSETDALGRTTTYTYDQTGNMIQSVNPLEQVTELVYDPVGNLKETTLPGGRTTSYQYDGNYNLTKTTDPMGNATSYAYDKSNRLTKETDALNKYLQNTLFLL